MPQPTLSDVHYNRPLSNVSVAYIQSAEGFASVQAFPKCPVQKQSDLYYVWSKDDFYRSAMKIRAPGEESAGSGFGLAPSGNYYCKPWALHKDIDDYIRANQDDVIDLERTTTRYLTQQMMICQERTWMTSFFKQGVWATDYDVTQGATLAKWDLAGSSPLRQIRSQIKLMMGATGYRPNKLILSATVFNTLVDHPDFIGRVAFGTPGNPSMVNEQLIAGLLGLDKVIIASAVQNTANEGQPGVMNFIAPPGALLCYAAPEPALDAPSAGYTFSWAGMYGAGPDAARILKMRAELRRSDRIEIEGAWDHHVVSSDLGVYFYNTLANP
jgi:hypothetical protein